MRRTFGDLISDEDDAWPEILSRVADAVRPVEVLTVDPPSRGEATLFALQVTTRSPLGAIALQSGGIVVDGGWLRILGAGHGRIGGGLREWNALDGNPPLDPPLSGALIVAYDALGGFFALNGGAWEGLGGQVHYFSPDTYQREPLDLTYSGMLDLAITGHLDRFYEHLRWPGWEAEVASLGPDEAFSVYPFLGFEPEAIEARSRRPVPARELWGLHQSIGEQVRGRLDGEVIQVQVTDAPSGDIPAR